MGKDLSIQAFFLQGQKGGLFSTFYPPVNHSTKQAVLFFPPFAEEMNKVRRSSALLGRKLAKLGVGFLQVDMFGTGDSEGDFSEARWDIWRNDMLTSMDWLRSQGVEKITFCGVRLGVLLALDILDVSPMKPDQLIFWQPVVNGEMVMTQFLRLRMAADLVSQGEKITVKDLRKYLVSGESVEVAGYVLSPELVASIDGLNASNILKTTDIPIHWLEMIANPKRSIGMANKKLIDEWQCKGVPVTCHTVVGEQFWATPEITVVPGVIELTKKIMLGAADE